jgi:hypothetical protein
MRDYQLGKKKRIRPEKVIAVLDQHGTKITVREAELILDLAYKFAKLSLEQVKNGGRMKPSPKKMTPRTLYR